MAVNSRPTASLLMVLGRFLLKSFNSGFVRRALAKLVKRLAFLGFLLRFQWVSSKDQRAADKAAEDAPSNASSKFSGYVLSEEQSGLVKQSAQSESYLDVPNGEVISLDNDDVAFSLYPSSETDSLSRLSTGWTQLRLQPYTDTRSEASEARSTSTYYYENFEVTSREEMYNTFSNFFLLSQSASFTRLNHPRIKPFLPQNSRRYRQKHELGRQAQSDEKVKARTGTYTDRRPPPGWVVYTHPEGARYFCNKDKRVFTDADLYDHNIFKQILEDISVIEEFISKNSITLPRNSDLVMDVFYSEKEQIFQTFYYFVHHASRSIFFLDAFEPDKLLTRQVPRSESHLRDEMEAQYWLHLQLFPHGASLSASVIRELRDRTFYFIEEQMTGTSVSAHTLDELYKILRLADTFERNVGNESSGAMSLLARLMHSFTISKSFLQETKKLPDPKAQRFQIQADRKTWLIKITSPLLFFAPDFYYRGLVAQGICGNRTLAVNGSDWLENLLFATLLLIVNVAFLGIHPVDLDRALPHRSAAQISSYVSAAFCVGSIVLGLVFSRQTKLVGRGQANGVRHYARSRVGTELIAIFYSVPYVLLMWSVITFALAFSFLCFQRSSKIARILVSAFGGIVFVLVILSILTSWALAPALDTHEVADDCTRCVAPNDFSKLALPSKTLISLDQLPENILTEATV